MLHLIRPFLEGLLANGAYVGIDLAVNDHVLVQVIFGEESLSARSADVGVHVPRALVPSQMRLQGVRGEETPLADLTLVAGLQVNQLGVRLQRVVAVVDASADGARHRELRVLAVHVPLYGVLRLEHLVAGGARVAEGIQVAHEEVLLHVRLVPQDGVAQFTGVLGLAMVHDHVKLQLLRRDEQLVAHFTRVLVELHVLSQTPLRPARERANVAGVMHASHYTPVLFTAVRADYLGDTRRRLDEECVGISYALALDPVHF